MGVVGLPQPPRHHLDCQVRAQLQKWPQRPPGVAASPTLPGTWLRGRPGTGALPRHPFLKFPGANTYRTLPDGLWLHFSRDSADPYVDILCIEACSSTQNLLDKRSRFAPSTGSLMAVCPVIWLKAPVQPGEPTPRWKLIRLLKQEPTEPLLLPVRDMRVVYGLKRPIYDGFAANQMPQPHEFFCPMEALMAEGSHEDPLMCALLKRATAQANFMDVA